MYKRTKYDVIEDIKDGLKVVGIIGLIGLAIMGIDRIDQHKEEATVIAIQRLDEQVVTFETKDGNLWEYGLNLDEPIDIGDKVVLTFKEYENNIREDDKIVNIEMETE